MSKPPVLLVHGFTTSARRTWVEPGWVDLLTEAGRRVIAPDLLGHGDAPKPHDVAAYAEVEALVAAELPDEPVDAVGYSAGARIVLALAAEDPSRFHRIVVGGLGGSLFVRREGNPILDALEGRGSAEDIVGQHFKALAESDGNDPEALTAFLQRDQPRLDVDDVARITCPTLVIIGDQDFAGPGEPLVEALPNGELITLRNVDHFGLPRSFDFVDKGLDFLGAAPF
jgi:pimeloyl-ACP methyl ester carboxylesterase